MEDKHKVMLERYKVIKKLAVGTFGTIWLAIDETTQDQYVIKYVPWKSVYDSEYALEIRKPQLYLSLDHPNIVRLHAALSDEWGMHFVLDYCNGGDLHNYIANNTISESRARNFMRQICLGCEQLHSKGIIHRDLKASNIFLHRVPDSPEVEPIIKIGDLGSARVALSPASELLMTVTGYYLYLSPELIKGEICTHKTDIWLLGILLYSMVTGLKRPFGLDMASIPGNIEIGTYFVPTYLHLSAECLSFLTSCLQYDPNSRADWETLRVHPFLTTDRYTPIKTLPIAASIKEGSKWKLSIKQVYNFS